MAMTMMTAGEAGRRAEPARGRCTRLRAVLDPDTCADWARRRNEGGACPADRVAELLVEFGSASDVRWWDEAQPLPTGRGFVLDLSDRPSQQGGLLLVPDGDRLTGWRPEAGALTVFEPGALLVSPVTPGAAPRPAILGRLA